MAQYEIDDGHGITETIEADGPIEAETAAQEWAAEGDYGEIDRTVWVDAWYAEIDSEGDPGDRIRTTVAIDPDEPDCTADEHDWQSPHELVGGIEENPGVWGHGGGVVITEVCVRCGCARETDTWAQRPDTGEQGLTGVSYDVDRYREDVERMIEKVIAEAVSGAGYDPESVWYYGETPHLSVLDEDHEDDPENDPAALINAGLPAGWIASYTGCGNTEADGTTTTDVAIERA